MKAMKGKLFHALIIINLLIIGGIISFYYWENDSLSSLTNVPLYVMILAFVYILFQILKRYLYKEFNWWDWLYYIGLAAMMLPTLFANENNLGTYNLITDYGIIFLIIPILLDGNKLIRSK